MNHHDHTHIHGAGVHTGKNLSDFTPLIVIFAVVIALTVIATTWWDGGVMSAMQFFMGFFFLVFGGFKTLNLSGFADAYAEYDLLGKRSRTYGLLYPFIELGLAILFLTGVLPIITSTLTLVLMLFSALGVYLKLRKKEEVPCACLGVVFKVPMTWVTLGEDLLMAAMAALMLFMV